MNKINMIVHTPTVNDYIKVVEYAIYCDVRWNSGHDKIFDDYWYKYKSNTCVNINTAGMNYNNFTYYFYMGEVILSIEKFHYETRYKKLVDMGFI